VYKRQLEIQARKLEIKPIFGLHLNPDFTDSVDILVADGSGFTSASRLASSSRHQLSDLIENRSGLIFLSEPNSFSLLFPHLDPDFLYLKAIQFGDEKSRSHLSQTLEFATSWQARLVASNQVWHGLPRQDDLLISQIIRASFIGEKLSKTILSRLPEFRSNINAYHQFNHSLDSRRPFSPLTPFHPEGWLKPPKLMARLFRETPSAVSNTLAVADMCQPRSLPHIKVPEYPLSEGLSAHQHLSDLCHQKLVEIWQSRVPPSYYERLRHEIEVISIRELDDYFLIMADLIDSLHNRGLQLSDMGSSTGSLVCYLLGITKIDPVAHSLSFDRFLTPLTQKIPDIDHGIDAQTQLILRGVVADKAKQLGAYTYRISTFPTYRIEGALSLVMKAFGYSSQDISQIKRILKSPDSTLPTDISRIASLAREISARNIYTRTVSSHPSKLILSHTDLQKL
jgi:hypothetical protein